MSGCTHDAYLSRYAAKHAARLRHEESGILRCPECGQWRVLAGEELAKAIEAAEGQFSRKDAKTQRGEEAHHE
jgi:hypothetical protein